MTNPFDDIVTNAQSMLIIGSNTTEQHPVFGTKIRQAVLKRKVKLVGDGSTPLAVAWVEYYRTGTATWQIDGKEVKIPFQIKEDFDLEEVNGD